MIHYRALRPAPGAPRGTLAVPGDDAYAKWFRPRVDETAELWLFLEDAPKKVVERADVIEGPGALIVRRSRIEAVARPWVESGQLRLRPVSLAPMKQPARPRFDKSPLEADYVIVDPTTYFAADRRAVPQGWLAEGESAPGGVLTGSRERALMIDVRTPLPFDEARAPLVAVGRLFDYPLDLWFDARAASALEDAFGASMTEGRSRPSPRFVDAIGYERWGTEDARADASAEAYFAWSRSRGAPVRAAAIASPHYATLVALAEGPSDDTRAAACEHPFYALTYARDVDRHGTDATREAAARLPDLALEYALVVDRAAHEATRAAVRGTRHLDAYESGLAREGARGVAARKTPPSAPPTRSKPPALARAANRREERDPWSVVTLRAPSRVVVSASGAPRRALEWGVNIADGTVTACTPDGPAGNKLAKELGRRDVLSSSELGPWILRRSLAEEIFAGVGGATRREIRIEHRGESLTSDHVLVDFDVDYPLDRDAAAITSSDPARPWASVVRAVSTIRLLFRSSDELAIARVSEFPNLVLASPSLVARFAAAKLPVTVVKEPHGHLPALPAFPLWDEGPPFPSSDDPSAVDALRRALAGDAFDRGACVASAWPAYALARIVDRCPSDDTRRGALQHPHTATLYARFVDCGPREDTRDAAALAAPTATFYASFVDRAVHPVVRAKLLASGWAEADLAELT
jgi:hypothetical protein